MQHLKVNNENFKMQRNQLSMIKGKFIKQLT